MPIDTEVDKEAVVLTCNGILLSQKEEQNSIIYRDVDGPRGYHTERSKLERENQVLNNFTYIIESRKMVEMTYLQS